MKTRNSILKSSLLTIISLAAGLFCMITPSCKPDDVTIITPGPEPEDTTHVPTDTMVVTPPVLTLMDSLLGTFTGTCYYASTNFTTGQTIRDTTNNASFTVKRVNANAIFFDGCGAPPVNIYGLPKNTPTNQTFSQSGWFGSISWSVTIDFPVRKVTLTKTYSGGGGLQTSTTYGVFPF